MSSPIGLEVDVRWSRAQYDVRRMATRPSVDVALRRRPLTWGMHPIATLARVPRRPSRADLLLVVALLAWALLEASIADGPGPRWGRFAFAVAITVPLLARRRAPFQMVVFVCLVTVAWSLH